MSGTDDTGNDRGTGQNEHRAGRDVSAGDISTHSSSDDRVVFSETGNSDAWIATDTTVTVER